MSDSFAPVIIIEGFLGLGVVLWLYFSHQREMKRIRADKAKKAQAGALGSSPAKSEAGGSDRDPKSSQQDV
ncbi:hypothetical protein GH816_03350 [Betaproteobacteria bacterium LSUCC0115]|nr:hypothetical protein [Burkholderiales bacterium LSUCC0115]